MTDSKSEAHTFHACARSVRDHLLACAQLQGDELPHVQNINHRVMELRGGKRPANDTSYDARDTLVGLGWIEEVENEGRWNGYRVTDAGFRALEEAHQEFGVAVVHQ